MVQVHRESKAHAGADRHPAQQLEQNGSEGCVGSHSPTGQAAQPATALDEEMVHSKWYGSHPGDPRTDHGAGARTLAL